MLRNFQDTADNEYLIKDNRYVEFIWIQKKIIIIIYTNGLLLRTL